MFYQKYGNNAKSILLLHGWGCESGIFSKAYQDFMLDYTVYGVDFFGFGKSPMPPKNFGIFDYAESVKQFIKSTNICPHIVGHSFGGRVAIVLTAKYPELCKSLVLVDSAGLRPRLTLSKRYKLKKYRRLKALVDQGKCDKNMLNNYGSKDYQSLPNVMKEVFVRVVNQDLSEYAQQISMPTLLFWGTKDKETPYYMAKRLRKMIKNSNIIHIKAGHYSFLENNKTFVQSCLEFWQKVEDI